jgi:hypothetical protein
MSTDPNDWMSKYRVAPTPQPPAPSPGGLRTIVPAAPKEPRLPTPQTPAQARKDEADASLAERKLAESAKPPENSEDAAFELRNVIQKAREAKELSRTGWFATGFGADAAKGYGGTTANDVAGLLDVIGANTAFTKLQKMREDSPTGGALGQVTERELDLLKSTVASLKQSQSDEQFQRSMDDVIGAYERVLARLEGERGAAQRDDVAAGVAPAENDDDQPSEEGGLSVGGDPSSPGGPGSADYGKTLPNMPVGPSGDPVVIWTEHGWQGLLPSGEFAHPTYGIVTDPSNTTAGPFVDLARKLNREYPYGPNSKAIIEAERLNDAVGEAGLGDLAQQGITLGLSDEGAGIGAAIGKAIRGDFDVAQNYQTGRDAERIRLDQARETQGGLGTAAEILGGFGSASVAKIPQTIRQAAGAGARAGGLAGFGYGEGAEESALGAFAGAAVGAPLAAGMQAAAPSLGRAASRFFGRNAPGGEEAATLARQAQEEGVPVSRPIIDPGSRASMARMEAQPGGHTPVRESLDRTREGIAGRVEELSGAGSPQEPGVMGQRIQAAAQRDLDTRRAAAGNLYEQAAKAAPNAKIVPREVVKELDRQLAELMRNPNRNQATISYLQSVRRDFVSDKGLIPKSIEDIRALRTDLSDDIRTRNLTMTNAERLTNRIIDRAAKDIERDLYDAGPGGALARQLYREADIRWRLAKREERQVIERLLGPSDRPMRGDQTMNAALAWLREGAEGQTLARRMWEKLPKVDRDDLAATVADKFGRRSPDEEFSAAQFLAATRNIPVSSRALLFGDEGAKSITNLRALTKEYQAAEKALNNSRSGMVGNWANWLSGLTRGGLTGTVIGGVAGGVPGGVAGGLALSGGEAIARRLNARMLMSNDVSRWLSVAPRMRTPEEIAQHIERLTPIATRNPVIAQDVLGLQSSLAEVFAPTRLAASNDPDQVGENSSAADDPPGQR